MTSGTLAKNFMKLFWDKMAARLEQPFVIRETRNRKYTEATIDIVAVSALNFAVEYYLKHNVLSGLGMAAIALQTAQDCYDEIVYKPPARTGWRENIKSRIADAEHMLHLLDCFRKEVPLERNAVKEIRAYAKKFNKILEKPQELEEVRMLTIEAKQKDELKLRAQDFKRRFTNTNRMFELYTGRFYRQLEEKSEVDESSMTAEKLKQFWSQMWVSSDEELRVQEYVSRRPHHSLTTGFPSVEEFKELIKNLGNWKSPGADGIFNYYIKWLPSLHEPLYKAVQRMCLDAGREDDWLYRGVTYLIPKNEQPTSPSQYRPITCMSNLYKLMTRCVTESLKREVEARGLLTENQMGTKRRVQGAKEHALTNIVINSKYEHGLHSTWVDVMKAFDSVDHRYLMHILESLHLPGWVVSFVRHTISRWHIDIRWGKEALMTKAIGKGILQGDSLSPLLFVLCMDPLSRKLNALYPPVKVRTPDDRIIATNHLLYIDDLKIFTEEEGMLKKMTEETQKFFEAIGFRMNRDKSATNSPECSDAAKLLEGTGTYKYLGITEDGNSRTSAAMLQEVTRVIVTRLQLLLKTDLSAKNLFRAINQYALTVINYFIGVVPTEKDDMAHIDKIVRRHLRQAGVIKDNSNVSRLYLPRKEMGRGLHNLQHKAEAMMLRLWLTLTKDESRSVRRAAICQHYRSSHHRVSLIVQELKDDYGLDVLPQDPIEKTIRDLRAAQTKKLHDVINETKIHKLLFSLRGQRNIDFEGSTLWMRKSMLNPQEEAKLVNLQDRNLEWMNITGTHMNCGKRVTVDHLATRCDKLVNFDYTRRHDEIVRRIHLVLARQLGIKRIKKVDKHKVEERIYCQNGNITFNKAIPTDKTVTHNKPDIVVTDKRKNTITLVEIGITSKERLTQVEIEKKRKYEPLTKQMSNEKLNEATKFRIVPYVMTWDGLVTK